MVLREPCRSGLAAAGCGGSAKRAPSQSVHPRRQPRPAQPPVRPTRPPLNQHQRRPGATPPAAWELAILRQPNPAYDLPGLTVGPPPLSSRSAHPSVAPGAQCSRAGSRSRGTAWPGSTSRSCPTAASSQNGSPRDRLYTDAGPPERRAELKLDACFVTTAVTNPRLLLQAWSGHGRCATRRLLRPAFGARRASLRRRRRPRNARISSISRPCSG